MSVITPTADAQDDGADVEILGPVNMNDFFAAASSRIVSIVGTGTSVTVTLQSGVVLRYEGTGLTFNGTTPTGGTVTSVSILGSTGAPLAVMDLSAEPLPFNQIRSTALWESYLARSHVIYDAFDNGQGGSASLILGGNLADQFGMVGGADTVQGLGGDDLFSLTGGFSNRPAGAVLDGGRGFDSLFIHNSGSSGGQFDLRDTTLLSIEAISLDVGTVIISGAQIGGGQIAADAVLRGVGTVQIDQVAGTTLDVSGFVVNMMDLSGFNVPTLHLRGTSANDVQIGNNMSNDLLEGFGGRDSLNGGDGRDTIYGGDGNDRLLAGGNSDRSGRSDELYGGAGNDTLLGGTAASLLDGGAGNDLLRAESTVGGSSSRNGLFGGAGNDTLESSTDAALMEGGSGNDRYVVRGSNVQIFEASGGGSDTVLTSVHIDLSLPLRPGGQDAGEIEVIRVDGTQGLKVTGTASNNRIEGNSGADTLNGAAGADTLSGGAGHDSLDGGDGADRLSGGGGIDALRGGAGADTFVFRNGFGRDEVMDFGNGADVMDLSGLSSITSYADMMANHVQQVGTSVWIDAGGGDVVILANTTVASLTADEFVF